MEFLCCEELFERVPSRLILNVLACSLLQRGQQEVNILHGLLRFYRVSMR